VFASKVTKHLKRLHPCRLLTYYRTYTIGRLLPYAHILDRLITFRTNTLAYFEVEKSFTSFSAAAVRNVFIGHGHLKNSKQEEKEICLE
jgi:hypothetical protein